MGAPNASVRILVAMSILKEGFGCSDEDLFEKCEFDLLARKALGLEPLDDKLPSLDIYYLFGRRLADYEQKIGVNLRDGRIMIMLNPKLRKKAEMWLGEDSGKTVYRSNNDEMAKKLVYIGLIHIRCT